jgi:hypothetical protein
MLYAGVAALVLSTSITTAEASAAEGDITIAFTAKVVSAFSRANGNPVNEAFGVKRGQKLTGVFRYNKNAVDENPEVGIGVYRFTTAPYGVQVKSSNKVIAQTNPNNVNFGFEITNNFLGPSYDTYLFQSSRNIGADANSVGPQFISWQLDDPTGQALQSEALPSQPPNLTDWQSISGFELSNEGPRESLRAVVTEARQI